MPNAINYLILLTEVYKNSKVNKSRNFNIVALYFILFFRKRREHILKHKGSFSFFGQQTQRFGT